MVLSHSHWHLLPRHGGGGGPPSSGPCCVGPLGNSLHPVGPDCQRPRGGRTRQSMYEHSVACKRGGYIMCLFLATTCAFCRVSSCLLTMSCGCCGTCPCAGEIDTDPEEQRRIEEHQRKREEAKLRAARVEAKSRRCELHSVCVWWCFMPSRLQGGRV